MSSKRKLFKSVYLHLVIYAPNGFLLMMILLHSPSHFFSPIFKLSKSKKTCF